MSMPLPDCPLRLEEPSNPEHDGTCCILSAGFSEANLELPLMVCASATPCDGALEAGLCPLGWV